MSTFSLNTHVAAALFNKPPVYEKQQKTLEILKTEEPAVGSSIIPFCLVKMRYRCSHHSLILLVVMSVAPSCTLFILHCELVLIRFNACSVRQLILLSKKHQEKYLLALMEEARIPLWLITLTSKVRNLLFD